MQFDSFPLHHESSTNNEMNMEKINLAEGLMAQMMEEEAWKDLSGSFGFTLQMLEKYQDRLDWEEISGNTEIVWTVDMLDKFKKRINWTEFSRRCDESLLTVEIVERFKDYFDWKELSGHSYIPLSIVDRFPDLIDWKEFIRGYQHDEILTRAFIDKYKEYIPVSSFKDSGLWNNIVNEIRKDIESRIRSGKI